MDGTNAVLWTATVATRNWGANMTRINVVPVKELCDQHLLAEHREITRIPNGLMSGKLKFEYEDRPMEYVLGEGHVKFFTNKLRYLFNRYQQLDDECIKRGFNTTYIWPQHFFNHTTLRYWDDYRPTRSALYQNRLRIKERLPAKPRHTAYV